MIIVKYKDKRSLVIFHDSKDDNSRNESATISKFNTRFKEQLCKSAGYARDRKLIVTDNFTNVLLLANDRIGVAKHDSELYHWKVTADKGSNTGIDLVLKFFLMYDGMLIREIKKDSENFTRFFFQFKFCKILCLS